MASEPKVCLDPPVAQFFRDAYYKGQRDSTLLKNCNSREKDYVTADSVKKEQIASYKRDSTHNVGVIGNLREQRRVSVDSTVVVGDKKLAKVKKRSATKTWIILGLLAILTEVELKPL